MVSITVLQPLSCYPVQANLGLSKGGLNRSRGDTDSGRSICLDDYMAQPISEVLLGELLLPTSHAILMAASVVLLDSYSQNWGCILVSSSFSPLHTQSY